jgi:hypothetical protein
MPGITIPFHAVSAITLYQWIVDTPGGLIELLKDVVFQIGTKFTRNHQKNDMYRILKFFAKDTDVCRLICSRAQHLSDNSALTPAKLRSNFRYLLRTRNECTHGITLRKADILTIISVTKEIVSVLATTATSAKLLASDKDHGLWVAFEVYEETRRPFKKVMKKDQNKTKL